MTRIHPVLLCGGTGSRLWPLSRKSYPKQFSVDWDGYSLFQQTALRLSDSMFHSPTIVTAEDYRFLVSEQLREIEIPAASIMVEPSSRNTASAIIAATLSIMKNDPDALLLVTPSDHVIPDAHEFCETIEKGVEASATGHIITFGIQPTRPETGYGYLKVKPGQAGDACELDSFIEKPCSSDAERMFSTGDFLWNAGIFLYRAGDLVEAFKAYSPDLYSGVVAAFNNAQEDLDFTRLDADNWNNLEDISIDYAIMEKASNLKVVNFCGRWSDLGDWQAIHREFEPNDNGMVLQGYAHTIDCENSLLRSESEGQQLVGIGLDNMIVVAMPDAVLVADKSRAQDVKEAVAVLKKKSISQAENFPRDNRPWGWYETLALSERFQVKRIVVKPGGCLSLQSHFHRSEHWIVVAGTARITIGEEVRLVTENESVYIPLGTIHRMENPGKLPMVLIEVQTGVYLEEDDIVRYEDIYARS